MSKHAEFRMTSDDRVKDTPYIKKGTNLCRLPNGLSCMGCCGMDYLKVGTTKTEFIAAMKQSADEYKTFDTSKNPYEFKKRVAPDDLHDCGSCKQLILTSKGDVKTLAKKKHICFTCPLHPAENKGKEYRHGECDFAFMCKAQRQWSKWSEPEQAKFLAFIESKNLDWFEYSKRMNNDSLLNEFIYLD